MKISSFYILNILILTFNCTSCINTKNVTYLNNAADTTYLQHTHENTIFIQKNDILSISISSLNPEASAILNTTNNFVISASTASGSSAQSSGYLVNTDGYIQLPILGNIKVDGLTKAQLKEKITQIIIDKKLLIDPIVNIRHLNFEVTVIGEVGHPTVITVPSEKISLLKAVGLAGDITIYGKKNKVLLIRESEGKKKVAHLDLSSQSFITSPYYYLQPNDIVYVESNKNKVASVDRGHQLLPSIIYGIAVIAVVIVDRIK